jgi:glycosyltransferase involved in cell wall biosynthesis
MVKNTRLKVGLLFSHWANWIGGSYYIMNLIEALKTLPTPQQPHICVYVYEQKDLEAIQKVQYPFISYHFIDDATAYNSYRYNIFERLVNYISLRLSGRIVIDKRPSDLSVLFPNPPDVYYFARIPQSKQIHWVPDFQEKHLPHFFLDNEVMLRDLQHQELVQKDKRLIFSSQAALSDFRTYYPDAQNEVWVMSFAVTHESYKDINTKDVLEKYNLPAHYFFAPNQFWVHKNHIVVIKAVEMLKQKGLGCVVAFSGKEYDHRNSHYVEDLKQYVVEHDLQDNIKFLGFIDRAEQLRLMKEAMAVIQPSLFEGWSTVVEDAKAMNQCIIASNLAVHQEQLGEEGNYFDPYQPESLATQLEKAINKEKLLCYTKDYTQNVQKFALDFIQIIKGL